MILLFFVGFCMCGFADLVGDFLLDVGEKFSEAVAKTEGDKFYDIVLGVDSLYMLHDEFGQNGGWSVEKVNETAWSNLVGKDDLKRISVVGTFNTGKTWFTNHITHEGLEEGFTCHTRGVSVKFPRVDGIFSVFLDTAGTQTPVPFAKYNISGYENKKNFNQLKVSTEQFQHDFIVEMSNSILVVVGMLTFQDQLLLERLDAVAKKKQIFIIHNWKKLKTQKGVDAQIQNDIFDTFPNVELQMKCRDPGEPNCDDNVFSWKSKKYTHFVTVNELDNRALRRKYNDGTFAHMRSVLNMLPMKRKKFDIVKDLQRYAKKNLKNFLIPDSSETQTYFEETPMKYTEGERAIFELKKKNQRKFLARTILQDSFGNPNYNQEMDKFSPKYTILKKEEEKLLIKLDVPGLDISSFECSVVLYGQGSAVTIKGKRLDKNGGKAKVVEERKFGLFVKKFYEPGWLLVESEYDEFKECSCRYCYKNGVLTIENYSADVCLPSGEADGWEKMEC